MENADHRAIAIVGVGAVLPDAPNAPAFWENVKNGRYSITEVAPDRWDPALYYDPDPAAPDKTYSKIGGWVREDVWDPVKWHLPIPPKVVAGMDIGQRWAIACTREVLADYGHPNHPLDFERTAVILGNAMAGEKHYLTCLRIYFPEYARELAESGTFSALPAGVREAIEEELHNRITRRFPDITEDTMPGELSNCIAGRITNLFNFRGPNFVTDAACASAMAALSAAVEGLVQHQFDAVVTGGIDRNMGASSFVKFCKIGALSPTGSRPYAEGADGFVMGEGAALFLMKRLADAERNGDRIYAVLRGVGGSSDGKGKGITAPNPIGQKLAVERGWQIAGLSPATVSLIEGHGTSTRVGDVVEVQSLSEVLAGYQLAGHSVALGSVKSNIGHLKSAAGAASILKATFALRDKVLPPSVQCSRTNPDIDFSRSPLFVNTELRPWDTPAAGVRRAGISAFGFGGTNFHVVMEEYIPHSLGGNGDGKRFVAVGDVPGSVSVPAAGKDQATAKASAKAPLRGALLIGATTEAALAERLRTLEEAARAGSAPAPTPPAEADLTARERLAIDFGDAAELATKAAKALKAFAANKPAMWQPLRAQGIFRGSGPAAKVAFLYTGQGSQYVNMLQSLRETEPVVAETFAEADRVLAPLLGKPLSQYIFVNRGDKDAIARAENDLMQTAITQPAVLATEVALTRLLAEYGIHPDMTMGHSLGEYGALVASGVLPFADALETVSARGREMTRIALDDTGRMAAAFAPLAEVEQVINTIDDYVVIANINTKGQAVIGGASKAVGRAMELLQKAGRHVVELPVSHAFHTAIVEPASAPMRRVLEGLRLQSPVVPVVANVTGEFYPMGPDVVPLMVDILARQIASPVQFVKGMHTLYDAGARVFIEVGPKKALQAFVDHELGDCSDVVSLFTNHPKLSDAAAFNQALCGLWAAGIIGKTGGAKTVSARVSAPRQVMPAIRPAVAFRGLPPEGPAADGTKRSPAPPDAQRTPSDTDYRELGRMFVEVMERGRRLYGGGAPPPVSIPVVITGAALGLPGTEHIFDDSNVGRLLRGEQFIDVIPSPLRQGMVEKRITRLVKSDNGGPVFESINNVADVIKLAGRGGAFDLGAEFGVPQERTAALDRVSAMAIGAGIDAMRDAGIPLVLRFRTTSKGTRLPDRWTLPDFMRDDTGVIFASAFPGYNALMNDLARYHTDQSRREQLALLDSLQSRMEDAGRQSAVGREIDRRMAELRTKIEKEGFLFDRRFLFRVLSMGHSQFAEYIGARGPNTQVNAACASTTQAVTLARDWVRSGRCRRVIVVSADDVTSDDMMGWFGAGFLATGAAATDEVVEDAALPFDRRRHGMIIGMGAAAMVVESAEAARERGLRPICEVLSAVMANSAYHGTRLDVHHIGEVMEDLVSRAEAENGVDRRQAARQMVFISHETYTPARGGSASAEIHALRRVFGDVADRIVIANTKGFTGHAMGAGIEDVLAVKALETGCVPPVANFKEIDPELGALNLSKGGLYPVEYALRLSAGFGSQICMTLLRNLAPAGARRRSPEELGYSYRIEDPAAWKAWLGRVAGEGPTELEVVQRTLRIASPLSRPAEATASPAITAQPARGTERPKASAVAEPAARQEPVKAPLAAKKVEPAPAPALTDPVKDRVLVVVSEKTGYPVDMLDTELDLEADLGVDTVKQAEIFAAIREAYGIPRDENLKLRDFPTLKHVIRFVYDRRPDLSAAGDAAPAPAHPKSPAATAAAPTADPVQEKVLEIVAEKTGYPRDMLDLDLDLEADLGVDTVKQAEIFADVRGAWDIPRDENLKLRDFPTLQHVIRFVHDRRPDLAAMPAPVPAATAAPLPDSRGSAEGQAAPADAVREKVLEIVAEKTGYPKDMLDLDLDLEADLGVDTVKQAEMFAAVRGAYDIPRDESLKLRDFPTLKHVIQFVYDRRPDLAAAPAPVPAAIVAPLPDGRGSVEVPQATDEVVEKVLEIVAEKTGYPRDMLDLELDLEADLGIDTVKQAEMFASVRAAFGIPRDENLKLRDFPTLAHVIQFARDRRAPAASEAVAVEPAAEAVSDRPAPASFAATDRIPRRVPIPIVRPPLSMCKPTGVSIGPGSRVLVAADQGGVGEALAARLREMGADVLSLSDGPEKWLEGDGVQGVYWLPALDDEGNLEEMDPGRWREAVDVRVKSLYETMRALYDRVEKPGTFLVSATRLGGQHGYDAAGATAPLGGAVTGFTKAYKRERPEALVKAVDFEPGRDNAEIAGILVEETLRDPGAVETGHKDGARWTVGMQEMPASDGAPGLTFAKDTVFLITGAAGSIVSAITADLAAASGGTFYLLDLTPEPDPADPDLRRFSTDRDGLKRDLFARLQARGERATPVMVEKELAAIERAQAAQTAIDAVRAAGGTPFYFAVNLTDPEAVRKVIDAVRERSGRIDVLLHAAGIERSRFLRDKDRREFDLVFDVKSDGWFNLMRAIGEMPIAATVAFSSIAGRFGNGGQTDYSSANDQLCKLSSNLRRTRPQTRGIAVDWTAWAAIGMAARGSIPKMMELAGIDMLAPEAGIPFIRRELTAGGTRGEVVAAQRLGVMTKEFDPSGGLASFEGLGPVAGSVASARLFEGLLVESVLDPATQPFLHDHQIDGTPVLPGVMGVEAFAEAALSLLPGWCVEAVEDVDFLAPFKFYRGEPRTVTVEAKLFAHGDGVAAECRLIGRRLLSGQSEPQETTHFTARVLLTRKPPERRLTEPPRSPENSTVKAASIYRVYFHGPAYQVVERVWYDGPRVIGEMSAQLPPNHLPVEQPTLMAPRLIELCFQTAGVWEMGLEGRMGLPRRIGRVSAIAAAEQSEGRLYAVVTPNPGDGTFDAEVVDSAGNVHLHLSGYGTVALDTKVEAGPFQALHATSA